MRKILPIVLLIILFIVPTALGESGENLLLNGTVDSVNDSGYPTDWYRDVWFSDTGVSELFVDPEGINGNCLTVSNIGVNDARWAQDVWVEPNAIYRLSAMVRAEDIAEAGYGANLSILGVSVYSDLLYNTEGDWIELELYGETGSDQATLTVCLRIGGYGDENLNTGQAWFDNIELVKLDQVPDGVFVESFAPYASSAQSVDVDEELTKEPPRYTETFLLCMFFYVLIVIGFARKFRRQSNDLSWRTRWIFICTLVLAFIVRLFLATKVRGYNSDIACFEAWSQRMYSVGPFNFYTDGFWCDYPPGYMLMLAPIELLRIMFGFGFNSTAHVVLIKLIPIVCDLIGAIVLYRFVEKRLGQRAALLLGVFYAFNPAMIIDSAAWGQIDSVLTLAIVVCALELYKGRYFRSLPMFAVAALIKPQALLFAPIGVAAIVVKICSTQEEERKREIGHALASIGIAIGILFVVSIPFCWSEINNFTSFLTRPLGWLWEKWFGAMEGYKHLSINTLNLYTIVVKNWLELAKAGLWQYIAWILFVISYVYSILIFALSKNHKKIFLIGGLTIVLVCTFGPMMHERYIFPAVLLLLFAYIECRDRRVLYSTLLLTVTLFMNQALVLQGGLTELNYGHLSNSEQWLNVGLAILNVLNALYLAWVSFDICVRRQTYALPDADPTSEEVLLFEPETQPKPKAEKGYKLKLRKIDYLLMAVVTAIYAIVAFTNLGVTSAPETAWVSSQAGETVEFDLGEERDFIMTYYGGICTTAFTVSFSDDGEVWSEPIPAKYDQGEIFRWIWLDETGTTSHARYVRLIADSAGLTLQEVGFLDEGGETYPIQSVTSFGYFEEGTQSNAANLTDEQGAVASYPSYLNSTYFDEIYHARTAYEHLHGLKTYEWTHPPLGKVLIMLGIQMFGMTPFGWRFMGTLAGVLMLPVMYLLIKQLTKRKDLAFIGMFLLAVDSMHFTQTRISTIDSYPVLFIMLSYLFMFRYSQMRWNRDGFARSLIPLGFCGLFMGISWATKWIGIYGSIGLVVIFFWTLWKNFQDRRDEPPHRPDIKNFQDRRDEPPLRPELAFFIIEWIGLLMTLLACISTILDRVGLLAVGTSTTIKVLRFIGLHWGIFLVPGLFLVALGLTILMFNRKSIWFKVGILSAFCIVAFIVVPVLIYYFSYHWHMQYNGGITIERVVNEQIRMFDYHAGLGGDTHYFRSEWYEWPVIAWPMWYFNGTNYMPTGIISSISCMGNPAVWWFGLVAILYVALTTAWSKHAPKAYLLVLIAFLSQYLPWVVVPRSTFIYHYFASVPFIIAASVLLLDRIRKRSRQAFIATAVTLCTLALVLFIAFYPLQSGMPVARNYANLLRWFNWINF